MKHLFKVLSSFREPSLTFLVRWMKKTRNSFVRNRNKYKLNHVSSNLFSHLFSTLLFLGCYIIYTLSCQWVKTLKVYLLLPFLCCSDFPVYKKKSWSRTNTEWENHGLEIGVTDSFAVGEWFEGSPGLFWVWTGLSLLLAEVFRIF